MTRRKSIHTIHEPFGDAFYYGPERMGTRFENDEEARKASGFSDSTFRTIMDRIEQEAAEVSRLPFCSVWRCILVFQRSRRFKRHETSLHGDLSELRPRESRTNPAVGNVIQRHWNCLPVLQSLYLQKSLVAAPSFEVHRSPRCRVNASSSKTLRTIFFLPTTKFRVLHHRFTRSSVVSGQMDSLSSLTLRIPRSIPRTFSATATTTRASWYPLRRTAHLRVRRSRTKGRRLSLETRPSYPGKSSRSFTLPF